MTPFDPCPAIRARVKCDLRHGKTTSEAIKDFVRRTCPCDSCLERRREMARKAG